MPSAARMMARGAIASSVGTTHVTPTIVASVTADSGSNRNATATFTSWTPAANDIVALYRRCTTDSSVTVATPSGSQTFVNITGKIASDSHVAVATYHVVTAAEAAAGTLTYTATNLLGGSRDGTTDGIVVRGVNPSNILDAVATKYDSSNANPAVLVGLSGADLTTGALIVSWVGADDTTSSYTTPSGWTQIVTGSRSWTGRLSTAAVAGVDVADTNIVPNSADEYISITVAYGPV